MGRKGLREGCGREGRGEEEISIYLNLTMYGIL